MTAQLMLFDFQEAEPEPEELAYFGRACKRCGTCASMDTSLRPARVVPVASGTSPMRRMAARSARPRSASMRDETKTESLDMAYIEHFGLGGLPFTVYTCPACGRRFAGDDTFVGRERLCFACGLAASRRGWDAKMAKADEEERKRKDAEAHAVESKVVEAPVVVEPSLQDELLAAAVEFAVDLTDEPEEELQAEPEPLPEPVTSCRILEFTLRFHGTLEQLRGLKAYMTEHDITYEKLE